MAWDLNCWSCKKSTAMETKVFRSSRCPHCSADMRACKNCAHFDEYASNQCKEPVAEYVYNKERANFCDHFTPGDGLFDSANHREVDDAKARLEALFKK